MSLQVYGNNFQKTFWQQYKERLVISFRQLSREEQESLIRRNSIAVTMGVTLVVLNSIYGLLPAILRVLGVPIALVGSYFAGKKLVTPLIIARFERHLKK